MAIEGVITIVGEKPGKTVTVMAGVHGDEVCGVIALKKLVPELKIKAGKVHFVIGNPRAVAKKVRQTEMNLNRAFRPEAYMSVAEIYSYEHRRALELMPLLNESEALLDVHSSTTKKSPVFIICEPHSYDVASRLPAGIIVHGFDSIEPGGTDNYMNSVGGKGICIECGFHEDPKAPKRAEEAIISFLTQMGCIDGPEPPIQRQRKIYAYYIRFTKRDFKPARPFKDFGAVKKGELVGHDGEEELTVPRDSLILFCRPRDGALKEAFVFAREE